MLQEQQEVGDASGAALFDELPLHGQRFIVGNNAKSADFKLPHS